MAFAGVGDASDASLPAMRLTLAVQRPDRRGRRRQRPTISCSRPPARSPSGIAGPHPRPLRAVEALAGRGRSGRRLGGCGGGACGCWRAPTASPRTIRGSMQAARATGADVPVCLDPRPRAHARHRRHPVRSARSPAAVRRCWSIRAWRSRPGRCSRRFEPRRAARKRRPRWPVRRPATRGEGSRRVRGSIGQRSQRPGTPAIELAAGDRRCSRLCCATAGLPARAHVGLRRDLLRPVRDRPRPLPRRERCGSASAWWVRATVLGAAAVVGPGDMRTAVERSGA